MINSKNYNASALRVFSSSCLPEGVGFSYQSNEIAIV